MATAAQQTNGTAGAAAAPAEVVRSFLLALQDGDVDGAVALLAEDVVYTNVSLPTVRGRRAVHRLARLAFGTLRGRFRLHLHRVAAEGQTVLTERTDALIFGRFDQRFWVCGRFEVRDGRIAEWRDYFDWGDFGVSVLRGLAGMASPRLNRRWPLQ